MCVLCEHELTVEQFILSLTLPAPVCLLSMIRSVKLIMSASQSLSIKGCWELSEQLSLRYGTLMGWSHTGTKTVLGRSQHWFRLASSWPSYDVPGMMICMHAKPSWEWHSVILRRSQDRLGKVLQLKISLAPSWDRLGKLPGLSQWWVTDGSSQDPLERLSSIP